MEEYSEFEKKVYDALIDRKNNEVSTKVQRLNDLLSKPGEYSVSLPDSKEILDRYYKSNEQNIVKLNRGSFMNKKIIYILGAAAVVLLGIFITVGNGDKPKDPQVAAGELKAKVTFVLGDVKVKNSISEEGVKPQVGNYLTTGQLLFTGEKAAIDLEFSHGSSIRIKANTEVAVKRLIETNGNITEEVSLKKGMLVANVTKQKQTDNFNIVTPTVIAGVRGTRFLVVVDPNAAKDDVTRVSVLDGSVGITKHKEEVPLTAEPFEIIEGKESGQELTKGGNFKRSGISDADIKIIEGRDEQEDQTSTIPTTVTAETEQSLFDKYGRLEVLSLDGGSKVVGVITAMDENTFTVHTVKGFVKVDRKKVISHDAKQLK
ncbi:MAG TPA: FecR family protein [Leptospiraceae bacterium]|nr:FecR family protein [Leptospiraceae bacterium]HMW03890.1 FecR family protein [Leptospiraceae bacterium]HMX32396.1 FecR family protein [Leptospiraceae bacterium]HMY29870.1 FecR family protein [Leptospiraceae bacterium]HMZ62986.1 FecR family protein [Leptospiraceae bacterium]